MKQYLEFSIGMDLLIFLINFKIINRSRKVSQFILYSFIFNYVFNNKY